MSVLQMKNSLRKEIRRKIDELDDDYCREASEKICMRVTELPEYKEASCIFCFVGTKGEPDTSLIIRDALERGKKVGVPLCVADGIMEVREITDFDEDLQPGLYNIPEPKRTLPLLGREQIEFAVIPCVTCDHEGNRLGHGKGYYDRYMEKAEFKNCIICFEKLISGNIPMERWDKPADRVITDV